MQSARFQSQMVHKTNLMYVLFVLILYLLIFNDLLKESISILQYTDEFIALWAIPLLLMRKQEKARFPFKKDSYSGYLLGFVICGLAGNIIYELQIFTSVLVDMLLCLKFWLMLYVGRILFQSIKWEKYARNLYFHVRVISWVYFVCIILDWIWNIFGTSNVRYGIKSVQLFYGHPATFAAYNALLFVILISIRDKVHVSTKYIILLLSFMCLSLRSVAFAVALLFLILYYLICLRRKRITIRTIIVMALLAVLVGWSQIYFYFFSSIREGSARAQLLIKSFQVASDHFTGTGFGTFASYISGVNYSPVYAMYGLDRIQGLEKGNAAFINDSFWPAILGQTGYPGTILYIIAVIMLYLKIQKLKVINKNRYCAAFCILAYLMVDSLAASAFMHPSAMPMGLWLGILLSMR